MLVLVMKISRPFLVLAPVLIVCAATFTPLRAATSVTETASEASISAAGFSPERLRRIDAVIEDEIARHRIVGGIVYIARDGRPVQFKTYGQQDVENGQPMRTDAIFRIASMSKAVTTTAVMMLYEEGKFRLQDPVSKYIPAFKNSVVAAPPPAGTPPDVKYVTEKTKRPVSIRHLLTHTAGLTYGNGPAADAYKDAGLTGWYILDKDETIEQVVDRLAALPLHGHPGESWQYGYATDVLGRLVEVISGQPLDKFIEERITKPLGMRDTHFFLPPEKASRLANLYAVENDQLVLKETAATSDFIHGPRKCLSGGAGLLSTTSDYARFLQMLLNGGELDGVRLLAPKTVELMRSNHTGDKYLGEGDGFGLGFWVIDEPGKVGEIGTKGAYGWGSAYFPEYAVDPKERLIILFMTQLRPAGGSNLNHRIKQLTYQALVK